MYRKNFFKEAVVLLWAVMMVLSTGAVVANTSTTVLQTNRTDINTKEISQLNRGIVWDNVVGVHGALGGIIVSSIRVNGSAFPADDFHLETTCQIDSIFWQGGYFQCQLAQGQKDYHWDWRILFWDDEGTGAHPENILYNWTIPDTSITREFWYNYTRPDTGNTYWVANYSCDLPETVTFNAGTTYWITLQTIHPTPTTYYPQGCWCRHNDTDGGILLHQAVIKAAWWGYADWTDLSVLAPDGKPHDLNYQLYGPEGDNTPPVTTCDITGTNPVTVTLTATDSGSGVNFTKYKLDSGAWATYTAPLSVTEAGNHVIYFYSVDKAGNSETEKNASFTVQAPPITITIKGGLGVSAVIENTGSTNLTNISWSIALDGKLIFIGKNKPGTIDSLPVGESVTVKDFVIGFGKTGIAVTAGSAEATTSGTVLLFLVIGVS